MKRSWPDYMARETLADRLDLKPGAIDQYVKRGLLPHPIQIGEARRWSWRDVDNWIRGVNGNDLSVNDDPFLAGIVSNGNQKRNPSPSSR